MFLYGRIVRKWKPDANQIIYDYVIPSNTKAMLHLDGVDINKLMGGGKNKV